jgi:NAD(P)-dependent dehydrogenase (short-subunit alcohol dehydrogenase family)
VGDSGEPDRVVASAVERFGSVDIMVNNAGRACAGAETQRSSFPLEHPFFFG